MMRDNSGLKEFDKIGPGHTKKIRGALSGEDLAIRQQGNGFAIRHESDGLSQEFLDGVWQAELFAGWAKER